MDILASWAPGLGEGDHVIVNGTLIPTDRICADEPYYSQKHRKHGMNVQVVAAPDGTPLWFSRATAGRSGVGGGNGQGQQGHVVAFGVRECVQQCDGLVDQDAGADRSRISNATAFSQLGAGFFGIPQATAWRDCSGERDAPPAVSAPSTKPSTPY